MTIIPERPTDGPQIEHLIALHFGPERFRKTVYRFRDGVPPVPGLCFVNVEDGQMRGTLRFWPILIGHARQPGLLLGPLAVDPAHQGRGFGKALMHHGLAAAKAQGHRAVLLVGDPEYYEPFGFRRALAAGLSLPGWVEERRFQGLELAAGALAGASGPVLPALPARDAA
ncbi:MAG: N-acetyltransferase [Thalassobaculales bacterium]